MIYRKVSTEQELRKSPTISTVVIDDTDDNVGGTKDFQINIRHCRDWKPSCGERYGFMANVTYRHSTLGSTMNGTFFTGVDKQTYDKAMEEGKAFAEQRQNKLNEEMSRIKNEYRRQHKLERRKNRRQRRARAKARALVNHNASSS